MIMSSIESAESAAAMLSSLGTLKIISWVGAAVGIVAVLCAVWAFIAKTGKGKAMAIVGIVFGLIGVALAFFFVLPDVSAAIELMQSFA